MRLTSKKLLLSLLVLALFTLALFAARQEVTPGDQVNAQLRALETPQNSRIMWIEHELTDVYGPRLTGTPNLKAADDWAIKTMASFGMTNTHLEPYPFIPTRLDAPVPGWDNLTLQADAVSPFHGQLMV
ncbi:MAG TPA: hypothetical protein VIC32_05210, partial [Terriglobales bacterium]